MKPYYAGIQFILETVGNTSFSKLHVAYCHMSCRCNGKQISGIISSITTIMMMMICIYGRDFGQSRHA